MANTVNVLGCLRPTGAVVVGHARGTLTSRYVHVVDAVLLADADRVSGAIARAVADETAAKIVEPKAVVFPRPIGVMSGYQLRRSGSGGISDLLSQRMLSASVSRLLAGIVVAAGLINPAFAQQLTREEMTAYLTQSICIGEAGAPMTALPIDDKCLRSRLQRSDDLATYRKHDWPNVLNVPAIALGYQASDSVIQRRASRMLVVQTFDFGTDGRTFGKFDGGLGDGGQVAVLVDGWASFVMTEDGGGGVQWFVGEGCRTSSDADAKSKSWLTFRDSVTGPKWGSALARLNITGNPNTCPSRFNDAYTRYRTDRIEFPFRVIDVAPVVTSLLRQLDVVVSEHYGGSDIRSADHLERFFFAKRLGLVRWERWANGGLVQPPAVHAAAHMLAQTARCPNLEGYGAPNPNWQLADCRTWTTLVRQTTPWSVDNYQWPALNGFGRPD